MSTDSSSELSLAPHSADLVLSEEVSDNLSTLPFSNPVAMSELSLSLTVSDASSAVLSKSFHHLSSSSTVGALSSSLSQVRSSEWSLVSADSSDLFALLPASANLLTFEEMLNRFSSLPCSGPGALSVGSISFLISSASPAVLIESFKNLTMGRMINCCCSSGSYSWCKASKALLVLFGED